MELNKIPDITEESLAEYRRHQFCVELAAKAAAKCTEHSLNAVQITIECIDDPADAERYEEIHGYSHVFEHANKKLGLGIWSEDGHPIRNLMVRVYTMSLAPHQKRIKKH